jgi:hypothetical protein
LGSTAALPGAYPFDFYIYDTSTFDSVRVHTSYVVGSTGQPSDALPAPNGALTVGAYSGVLWTSADADGSSINLDPSKACVNGTAVQVPLT